MERKKEETDKEENVLLKFQNFRFGNLKLTSIKSLFRFINSIFISSYFSVFKGSTILFAHFSGHFRQKNYI